MEAEMKAKEDGPPMESDPQPAKQQLQQHQGQTHPRQSRILHNCASSLVGTASKAYSRLERARAPTGPLARRLRAAAFPFLHPTAHRCLAALALADDRITKAVFAASPSAAAALARLDLHVERLSAALPDKFDDAVDRLSDKVHGVPLIGSVARACECLVSVLTDWPSADVRVIGVDVSCDGVARDGGEEAGVGRPGPYDSDVQVVDGMREKNARVELEDEDSDGTKGGGEGEDPDDDAISVDQVSMVTADGGEGLSSWDEPGTILELLDDGWHSAAARRRKSTLQL